ncbi:unnamed protein product [Urochloa decumbens]|uniref:Uncharacterized protein n=1 Tax=Urochloa decumbens TaxID=240449 RepID=A0ABC8WCG3_9POAL
MAQELVWIFCKGDTNLNVAIRDNKVILVRADPNDETQQWLKHDGTAGRVLSDDEDQMAFVLQNKATGHVMVNKDAPRADGNIEVQLGIYGLGPVRVSMFWTEEIKDHGDGYRRIRALRDISMTLDGLFGNVKEGTVVGIYRSNEPVGVNGLWKMKKVEHNI